MSSAQRASPNSTSMFLGAALCSGTRSFFCLSEPVQAHEAASHTHRCLSWHLAIFVLEGLVDAQRLWVQLDLFVQFGEWHEEISLARRLFKGLAKQGDGTIVLLFFGGLCHRLKHLWLVHVNNCIY